MGQAQFYIAGMTDLSGVIGAANPAIGGTDTLFKYDKKISDFVDTLETAVADLSALIGTSADDVADNTLFGKGSSVVKSVQYGSIALSVSQTSNTATITAVVVAKSLLVHLGCTSGDDLTQDTATAYTTQAHFFTKLALTNTTTITASRGAHDDKSASVNFAIIEFY